MGPITDIKQLGHLILRRWAVILAPTLLVIGATALYSFSRRPIYEAAAMVLIEKEGQNTVAQEGVKIESLQDDYYQTQYEILQSRTLAERVAKKLKITKHPEYANTADPAGALRSHLRILPVRRSRLVKVAVKSIDPTLAPKIANAIAEEFAVQNLEGRLFLSREVLRALEERDSSLSVESLPAVVNSALIQELKTSLARLRSERAQLTNRYQSAHPQMIQLNARIAETQDQLDREIGHIAESVKIQLSGHLQGNNVRLIDPAQVPTAPVSPNKKRDLAMAVLFGLSMGLALAFLVDRMDLTIRTPEDMEKWVKLPVMPSVPLLRAAQGEGGFHRVWSEPRSRGVEAFRNVRTAVSLALSAVKDSTTVLVTSAVQSEGKSFVSANLARSFAQAGQRVLLIDGDLRHPNQARLFGLRSDKGLSNYLAGDGPAAAFAVDSGVPNLKILPGGPVEENPLELLNDRPLRALLHWASGEFDRIIVDTPPLLPVTDALLWRKTVHGAILVVRANHARAAAVQRAARLLKENFGRVLGAVLNQDAGALADPYYYVADMPPSERRPRRPAPADRQEV